MAIFQLVLNLQLTSITLLYRARNVSRCWRLHIIICSKLCKLQKLRKQL